MPYGFPLDGLIGPLTGPYTFPALLPLPYRYNTPPLPAFTNTARRDRDADHLV